MARALLIVAALLVAPPPERPPSLEAKIGQMLMVGFRGTVLSSDAVVLEDIAERNLGGVVLFEQSTTSTSSSAPWV